MTKYYIASPGFNEKQLNRIKEIESFFDEKKVQYYSPFKHGGTLKLTEDKELNKVKVKTFFDENINQIRSAGEMFAIVGEEDKGTAFEVGYLIGYCELNKDEITKRLTLIDDIDGKFSKTCDDAIFYVSNNFSNNNDRYILDISEKNIFNYIVLGILYALGVEVITWSNKVHSSNLMTACSTSLHYQYPDDGNLKIEDLLSLDEEEFDELFEGKRFNLSNMKFKDKIE